jgi:regulator of sigma E protease
LSIALMVLGFGLVVFFHELGHFLAAKYVGIRVDQFAVGFGRALISFRKGLGLRFGPSGPEFEKRIKAHLEQTHRDEPDVSQRQWSQAQIAQAAAQTGISETEYRINWLPLGGYVRMLGQDDLDPTAQSADPRSFNMKSIRARMLVISAGVIMNVIMAALLFMGLFLMGYRAPAPTVRSVQPFSPAQEADLRVGDRFLELDGWDIHDANKLKLNIALVREGRDIPATVVGADGQIRNIVLRPRKSAEMDGVLGIGVEPPSVELLAPAISPEDFAKVYPGADPATDLMSGDAVVAVGDTPVGPGDYHVLYKAVQEAAGRPVGITVRSAGGTTRPVAVKSVFSPLFGRAAVKIAGMYPPMKIDSVNDDSVAQGKLQRGDLVTAVQVGEHASPLEYPNTQEFTQHVQTAVKENKKVIVRYLRDGKEGQTEPMAPTAKTGPKTRGLGVSLGEAVECTRISSIAPDSPLAALSVPRGSRILRIDDHGIAPGPGQPDAGWFEVHRLLRDARQDVRITFQVEHLGQVTHRAGTIPLAQCQGLRKLTFTPLLALRPMTVDRQTNSPLVAAAWGVTETRDSLLQFYVTLHRLVSGSVPADQTMGPLGILTSGAQFAMRGVDWLIWFLAMISANLAVVNFLPIPITDGGQFLVLLLEKARGKPLSTKAQIVIQYIGLAIILSLFLFVTYQDIVRMFS